MDSKSARKESMEKGLLILTRKVGETIDINNGEIVLTVKRLNGNRVSIAIEAAKDIPVMRGEIAKKKLAEVAA
jgi:carbon storage regulator